MLRACCTTFLAVVLESTRTVQQVKCIIPSPSSAGLLRGLYMLQLYFLLKEAKISSIVPSLSHSEVPQKC